jgi:hypothetical protein
MPSVVCPQCKAPAAISLGKAYCPQCGWNREAAERQTRLLLRLLPALVIVFDAPLIIWVLTGHAALPGLAIFGLLAIAPAMFLVLVVWRGVKKIETPANHAPEKPLQASAPEIAAPNQNLAEQFRILLELPRPRPVRLSSRGKSSLTVMGAGLLLLVIVLVLMVSLPSAGARKNIAPRRLALVYALPLGLAGVLAILTRRGLARERRLLAEGEVALGRVTRQWSSRNGNGIRYEFTTATGETISRSATDYSRQFYEGMSVPVFYEAQQPKRQIALCGSFYEIELPGDGESAAIGH